ncbi:MAG: TonB-dependent receptor plug domain-containing protein, partial [Pseudomonadota bacterium]
MAFRPFFVLGVSTLALGVAGAAAAQDSSEDAAVAPVQEPGVRPVGDPFPTVGLDELPTPTAGMFVTPLNIDQLERRYLTDPLEIITQVPNAVATYVPGFASGVDYTMRGLRDVGTYVDGILVSTETANHFGLLLTDRIDLVRGPAPLAFPQASGGGAVALRLHRPGERVTGRFKGSYGEFDEFSGRVAFDIPASNGKYAIGFNAYYLEDEGYSDNLTTGEELNEQERFGGRLAIRLTPSERVDWNIGFGFLHDESDYFINFDCDGLCDDRFATTGFSEDDGDPIAPFGGVGVSGEKAQFGLGTESDTFFLTSDFLLEGEHASLRLLSGYVDTDQDSAIDFTDGRDPPPAPGILPPIGAFEFGGNVRVAEERLQEGSQDVRIDFDAGGIDFGIGGAIYGRDEEIDVANVVTTDDDGPGGADPVTVLLADRIIDSDLRGVSAYADIAATLGI